MSELDEQLIIDKEKIRISVGLQLPIEITSYTLPRNTEVYIRNVMEMFLEECHQDHLKEYLNFCLSELLTNAKKANTKRVYFKEKGLDINDPDDYKKGMLTLNWVGRFNSLAKERESFCTKASMVLTQKLL